MSYSELQDTALRVARTLRALGIPFHVTGGLASSYYGEPRLTQDIDFVVNIDAAQIQELVKAFEPHFIINAEAVCDAINRKSIVQVLDKETYIKADLHVGEAVANELQRSIERELFSCETLPVVSKIDAILSKLLWVKQGSHKSRQDIIGMLLNPTPVDQEQLRRMARSMGVAEILEDIEKEIHFPLG